MGGRELGTDPDVVVDITPQDHVAGRDPQLEKGIDLARRALRKYRALAADLATRPRLPLPALPPRPSSNGAAAVRKRAARRR